MRRYRKASCLLLAALAFAACTSGDDEPAVLDVDVPPAAREDDQGHVDRPAEGWFESACDLPFELVRRIKRGYYPGRSPDVLFTSNIPTHYPNSHSGPWDYLAGVPLLLYGPGFIEPRGRIEAARDVTLADLAPTYAELLDTPFPDDRAGKVLDQALVPETERPDPPKLIMTIVWDGGGTYGLDAHPDSWPVLQRLSKRGTFFEGADTGSSPTITPAVHANIGTGTFPEQHGMPDIGIVLDGEFTGSVSDESPATLAIETLADIYDRRTNNEAKIGVFAFKSWHEAMIGLGAGVEGGDKDIAALVDHESGFFANEELYTLPQYLEDITGLERYAEIVDGADGKKDGEWMGTEGFLSDASLIRKSPAWAMFQTKILKELIAREGFGQDDVPDLLYTNYKQIDEVGHQMSMYQDEMGDIIRVTDAQMKILVKYLDRTVGKNQWVMAITADHGPAPSVDEDGGWTIHLLPFLEAMAKRFGVTLEEMEIGHRVGGTWPRFDTLEAEGFTMEEMADFIINYRIKDNAQDDELQRFKKRANEPLYSAAWPATEMDRVYRCSKKRSAG